MSEVTTPEVPETVEADGPVRPPKTELKTVRYVGSADTRSISAKSLKAAGVSGADDLHWGADNKYSLPVKGIKADILDLLAQDQDFVLE